MSETQKHPHPEGTRKSALVVGRNHEAMASLNRMVNDGVYPSAEHTRRKRAAHHSAEKQSPMQVDQEEVDRLRAELEATQFDNHYQEAAGLANANKEKSQEREEIQKPWADSQSRSVHRREARGRVPGFDYADEAASRISREAAYNTRRDSGAEPFMNRVRKVGTLPLFVAGAFGAVFGAFGVKKAASEIDQHARDYLQNRSSISQVDKSEDGGFLLSESETKKALEERDVQDQMETEKEKALSEKEPGDSGSK